MRLVHRNPGTNPQKGDRSLLENYHLIVLISQGRKSIEAAMDMVLRMSYTFHEHRFGFRAKVRTEHSTLRVLAMDLKAAYGNVLRDKLLNRAWEKLPLWNSKMLPYCLQPSRLSTKGDATNAKAVVTRGVLQGSPLVRVCTMCTWSLLLIRWTTRSTRPRVALRCLQMMSRFKEDREN